MGLGRQLHQLLCTHYSTVSYTFHLQCRAPCRLTSTHHRKTGVLLLACTCNKQPVQVSAPPLVTHRTFSIMASRRLKPEHSRSAPMSVSTGSSETYPGRSFSVPQLLHAVKKKLQATCFAGMFGLQSQNTYNAAHTSILQDRDNNEAG